MMPSYLAKMKIEASQQRLTIGASAIALCSFILPYPIDAVVGIPLAMWLLPSVVQLMNSSGVTEGTRQTIQWMFRAVLTFAILGLALFVYGVETRGMFDQASGTLRTFAGVAIGGIVILVALAIPLDRYVRRWCQKQLMGNQKVGLSS